MAQHSIRLTSVYGAPAPSARSQRTGGGPRPASTCCWSITY